MANTTFSSLKIDCLRKAGNWYSSSDSTLLTIAGSLINEALSAIQAMSPTSNFWLDLNNTVSTVASQEYVDLTGVTDILEILNVYQRETDLKLKRVDRRSYVQYFPDTTQHTGTPDLAYDVEQLLTSGENIFRIYLIPTPGSVITLRFDYLKNARFTADGTGADAEYCPLPKTFDGLIAAMFKPRFLEVIDPKNASAIRKAEESEQIAIKRFIPMLNSKVDETYQLGSFRNQFPILFPNVKATPTP